MTSECAICFKLNTYKHCTFSNTLVRINRGTSTLQDLIAFTTNVNFQLFNHNWYLCDECFSTVKHYYKFKCLCLEAEKRHLARKKAKSELALQKAKKPGKQKSRTKQKETTQQTSISTPQQITKIANENVSILKNMLTCTSKKIPLTQPLARISYCNRRSRTIGNDIVDKNCDLDESCTLKTIPKPIPTITNFKNNLRTNLNSILDRKPDLDENIPAFVIENVNNNMQEDLMKQTDSDYPNKKIKLEICDDTRLELETNKELKLGTCQESFFIKLEQPAESELIIIDDEHGNGNIDQELPKINVTQQQLSNRNNDVPAMEDNHILHPNLHHKLPTILQTKHIVKPVKFPRRRCNTVTVENNVNVEMDMQLQTNLKLILDKNMNSGVRSIVTSNVSNLTASEENDSSYNQTLLCSNTEILDKTLSSCALHLHTQPAFSDQRNSTFSPVKEIKLEISETEILEPKVDDSLEVHIKEEGSFSTLSEAISADNDDNPPQILPPGPNMKFFCKMCNTTNKQPCPISDHAKSCHIKYDLDDWLGRKVVKKKLSFVKLTAK